MKAFLAAFLAGALSVWAAGLDGRWAGTMEKVKGGPHGPLVEDYHLTLHQSGNTITGTVGPEGSDFEIQKARLENGKLTFEITVAEFLVAFDLQVNGDEITGQMESRKGYPILGKLRFKRQ